MKIFFESPEITSNILKQKCKFNGKNLRIVPWTEVNSAAPQQNFLTDEEIEKIAIKVTFAEVVRTSFQFSFHLLTFFHFKGQGKFGRN